ncbi:MAG: hypothetical protein P4L61_03165 [Candidatus Pacebacteria bacterium]|nr:hypothetical protein [Candidatus Paceibacterota bacterium]
MWWFLVPFITASLCVLHMINRETRRERIRQKILDWLTQGPARDSDLRSMLAREKIFLTKANFDSIIDDMFWKGAVDSDGKRWWIDTIKTKPRPVAAFTPRFLRTKKKAHAQAQ